MIHLDTSFLIRSLVPGSSEDARLRHWLGADEPLGMSANAWAEFLCGPVSADHVELATQIVTDRLPFSEQDATLAAELFNLSGRRRGSLGDCMIAAASMRATASLVTSNATDFHRFVAHGLELIDGSHHPE